MLLKSQWAFVLAIIYLFIFDWNGITSSTVDNRCNYDRPYSRNNYSVSIKNKQIKITFITVLWLLYFLLELIKDGTQLYEYDHAFISIFLVKVLFLVRLYICYCVMFVFVVCLAAFCSLNQRCISVEVFFSCRCVLTFVLSLLTHRSVFFARFFLSWNESVFWFENERFFLDIGCGWSLGKL